MCVNKLFNIILMGSLALLFFNCGEENKKETTPIKKVQRTKRKKECKIIIRGVFPKNDSFEVFYEENAIAFFSQEKTKKIGFLGSPQEQELVFDLDGIYPEKIRLDVGSNISQSSINIVEIRVLYDQEELIINSINFLQYLKPNQFIEYRDSRLNLSQIEKNGRKTYDPYLTSTPELIKALVEL